MSNRDAGLGDKVRCKIDGFTGVVSTHAKHLAGCDRLWVVPHVDENGKPGEGQWLDIDLVEIVEPSVVDAIKYNRKAPGGIDLPPSR